VQTFNVDARREDFEEPQRHEEHQAD